MKQSEEVFYNSSVAKVVKMIELYGQFREESKEEVETINSMKQIPGF